MRSVSNTPYFRPPKTRPNKGSLMLVLILLTILIPPFGLICLWRGSRCPLRTKLLVSVLGFLSMTLMFSLYLSRDIPQGVDIPLDYKYLSVTPTPIPIMPAEQTGETVPPVEQTAAPDAQSDEMAPANPA